MGWGVKNEGNDFWWRRSVLKGKKKGKRKEKEKGGKKGRERYTASPRGCFFFFFLFKYLFVKWDSLYQMVQNKNFMKTFGFVGFLFPVLIFVKPLSNMVCKLYLPNQMYM